MKFLWSLLITAVLCSCNKSEADAVTPVENNTNNKLIQSYTLDDKYESIYKYNDDNTLKEIIFKEDGAVQCFETFTYEDGKIVASIKKKADGSCSTKKQYEYNGNLIVKRIEQLDDKSTYTNHYYYNKDNFLEKVVEESEINGYKSSKIKTIEKLVGENKIRVEKTNIATHIITYDENLSPECSIPGYQPLVRIINNGIAGNILLTEIFPGDKCTTTIKTDVNFADDGKTILNSSTTFKAKNLDEKQVMEYTYK